MQQPQQGIVNGKKIYSFKSQDELIDFVTDKSGILIAIGVEKLLNRDEKLTEIINSNIAYCDGVGAVMALKKKKIRAEKIPGSVLWLSIVKEFYQKKSFYLLGAKEEIVELAKNKLEIDYKGINIVKQRDGYFKEEEIPIIEKEIIELKPDIIFVALGSPKQEYLMEKFLRSHKALYMGLGGSFDLYVGKAKEVPTFWKKVFRWEGIYRSFNDITNLKRWRRQFIAFKFFYKLWFTKL